MLRLAHACLLFGLVAGAGCGNDGEPVSDGGVDADHDGAADAKRPKDATDVGEQCSGDCPPDRICCNVADGGTGCVDPRTNPNHCGSCGVVCAEGRGTRCEDGRCVCGAITIGCAGNDGSYCCPPRRDGGAHYCANFLEDGNDCGGCDQRCDPAESDRCLGKRCVCGRGARTACEGTPEDRCCPGDLGGAECVDTTSSRFDCGGCGIECTGDERCIGGVCTIGDSRCEDGCPERRICCGGACCSRDRCTEGMCISPDGG